MYILIYLSNLFKFINVAPGKKKKPLTLNMLPIMEIAMGESWFD